MSQDLDLEYFTDPFPHFIINNFFTQQELADIWKELDFITNDRVLAPPDKTGTARDEVGNSKKSNLGVWLEELYTNHETSGIITGCKKIFTPELMDVIAKCHWYYKYLHVSNQDSTLVSYYQDKDYYESHHDLANVTMMVHLHKEPKRFSGGDLIFTEYEYQLPTVNNRCLLFPSIVEHKVTPIEMKNATGWGRYTISKFISQVNKNG